VTFLAIYAPCVPCTSLVGKNLAVNGNNVVFDPNLHVLILAHHTCFVNLESFSMPIRCMSAH